MNANSIPKPQVVHDTSATTPKNILSYICCKKCVAERPANQSMREWARLNVGFTKDGIQVVCVRHDCNVDKMSIQLPPEVVAAFAGA